MAGFMLKEQARALLQAVAFSTLERADAPAAPASRPVLAAAARGAARSVALQYR